VLHTFCATKKPLCSPQNYFWLIGVEVMGNNTDKGAAHILCNEKKTLCSPQNYFWLVGVEVIDSNNTDKGAARFVQ
jgi:hypothetical protein